jgi:hypothetical protein
VTADRLGGEPPALGGVLDRRRLGPDRDRPQVGRVGVEAEDDLAATLIDQRRNSICEMRQVVALIDFFKAEPALNFGTLLAAIWIFSPVCGFTPWRAPRSATENLPKPVKLISPPRFSVSSIVVRTASTAFVASPFPRPDSDATWSTNSDFVTFSSLRGF